MVIARRNTLIALVVLSAVVVQVGCGGGGHNKRQRVDRLLGKDGKPIGGDTTKKEDPKKDVTNPEGTTKDQATLANELLAKMDANLADKNKAVEAGKLLGAGTYTLQAVTTTYRFQENDSDDVFAAVFHSAVTVTGDTATISDLAGSDKSGKQGSNADAGKAFELAVHFDLTADSKLDKTAAKDLNTSFTEEKVSVDFGDGSPAYKILELLNGGKVNDGDTLIISSVDDSTVRIQIEAKDGSATRTVVAEYKKTVVANPGPTNTNVPVTGPR